MSAVSREWRAVARAEITIAQRLGVGGDAWSVTRMAGEGVASPVMAWPIGIWAGYVAEEDPATLSSAAPAASVGAKRWYAVGDTAVVLPTPPALPATLAIGDVIVSQSDIGLRFSIAAQDRVAGYVRYLLEPL
jgi:hypothetical protein